MTVAEEVRGYGNLIEDLRRKAGVLSLTAFEGTGDSGKLEPVFAVDLDTSRLDGYADRFFDVMFGLQEIFARPVDVWEKDMFDREVNLETVQAIPLELKHAA